MGIRPSMNSIIISLKGPFDSEGPLKQPPHFVSTPANRKRYNLLLKVVRESLLKLVVVEDLSHRFQLICLRLTTLSAAG